MMFEKMVTPICIKLSVLLQSVGIQDWWSKYIYIYLGLDLANRRDEEKNYIIFPWKIMDIKLYEILY